MDYGHASWYHEPENEAGTLKTSTIPDMADFLVMYATIKGKLYYQ